MSFGGLDSCIFLLWDVTSAPSVIVVLLGWRYGDDGVATVSGENGGNGAIGVFELEFNSDIL